MTTDLEISSTVETGASSADDEENVPFAFDMSNRVRMYYGCIKSNSERFEREEFTHGQYFICRLNYRAAFET